MSYPEAAWERAMKVQEVIMKGLTGEPYWYRAADILGFSPRTLRRWRERYESHGYDGLLDLRRRTPSSKRVPVAEVTRVVTLYREHYRRFNARHFHQIARRPSVRSCRPDPRAAASSSTSARSNASRMWRRNWASMSWRN
jgi:hypothetical protein